MAARRYFSISLTDIVAILFFIWFIYCYHLSENNSDLRTIAFIKYRYFEILIASVVYIVFRFLFAYKVHITTNIVVGILCICCLFETIKGFLQIIGIIESNNSLFRCTGSFFNPGPYGCFLAVCSCMLITFYSRVSDKKIRIIISFVAVAAIIILPSTCSRTAILTLFVGLSAYAFTFTRIKSFIVNNKFIIILIVSAFFCILYLKKKPSADSRFYMNKIAFYAMCDNGLTGSGLGSYKGAYGNEQFHYYKLHALESQYAFPESLEHERMTADCPEFSFNEFLRVGVECGWVGFCLFLALFIIPSVSLVKKHSPFGYGLLSLSIAAMFTYSLQMSQFVIMVPILLSYGAIDVNEKVGLLDTICMIFVIALLTILLIGMTNTVTILSNSDERLQKLHYWYNLQRYDLVVEEYNELEPDELINDIHVLFEAGQAYGRIGQYDKSDSILYICTTVSCDPIFWNVMGNNSMSLGRYREAEERYKHAFYMVPNRLYPLTLLAKLYDVEGDTVRFLKMADTVESFVPKVESVNTERLRQEIRDIKAGYIDAMRIDE